MRWAAGYESSSSQAISSPALEPGIYDISITGRKIEPQSAQVEVRAGQSTVVCLMIRNARRVETANDIAAGTGKVMLYTVGLVLYATIWVVGECLSDYDEDDDIKCPRCDRATCMCPSSRKQSPPPGPVSSYRKK